MSLIKKQVLVCNSCGKDVVATEPNIKLFGEDYFFCQNCLHDFMLQFNIQNDEADRFCNPFLEEDQQEQKTFEEYFKDIGVAPDEEPEKSEKDLPIEFGINKMEPYETVENKAATDDWDPNNDTRRELIVWDDYIVEKVVKLMKRGYTRKMICVELKLTESQFACFLYHVRHPEKIIGDNAKYVHWAKRYGDVLCPYRKPPRMNIDDDLKGEIVAEIKAGKKPNEICKEFNICMNTLLRIKKEFGIRNNVPVEERFTPKLVREMFEARKDGMSWTSIAQILNIPAGTIYALTNRLRKARPGDWMYDLAKEYGYTNN